MNYDVLEESRNAVKNLEQNAWKNHRENYVTTKGAVEDFKDRIDTEEYKISQATTEADIQLAQDELTKIIDEILQFNDSFNSSLITVDTSNELMDTTDNFEIDTNSFDAFLSNFNE